jgi:hypothetical protein
MPMYLKANRPNAALIGKIIVRLRAISSRLSDLARNRDTQVVVCAKGRFNVIESCVHWMDERCRSA